jgi:hypothetical protein
MFADEQTCLRHGAKSLTAHVPGRQGITCLLQRHAQLSRRCGPPTQYTLLPLLKLAVFVALRATPVTAFAVHCCLSTDSADLVLPAAGAARLLSLCVTYTVLWPMYWFPALFAHLVCIVRPLTKFRLLCRLPDSHQLHLSCRAHCRWSPRMCCILAMLLRSLAGGV